jgi:hypothetical protein
LDDPPKVQPILKDHAAVATTLPGTSHRGVEKHVIGPTPIPRLPVLWVRIEGGSVMEPFAERIIVMIVGIVQAYGEYSEFRQRMQFVGLRDPIVVLIDPKQKLRIHRVAAIDDPVSVSPVLEFVELCQG